MSREEHNTPSHNAPSATSLGRESSTQDTSKTVLKHPNDEIPDSQSKYPEYEPFQEPTIRVIQVVFAPWTSGRRRKETSWGAGDDPEWSREIEFEIWEGGIRAIE
jgi:hypothetical protein